MRMASSRTHAAGTECDLMLDPGRPQPELERTTLTNFIRYSARGGVIAIALGTLALAQQVGAPLGSTQFVPFNQFMANTSAAAFNSVAAGKVANAASFTEMRQHIINLYQ